MRPLVQRLADWHAGLAARGRQWLLAGVKPSWEAWIGTNYFVYPDANAYVNGNASSDPSAGIAASVQTGFAAVCTGGGACPATGALTQAQLDAALSDYLTFVSGVVAAAGLPRHKIITHAGVFFNGAPSSSVVFNSASASVTRVAKPGWSCYSNAHDPRAGVGLDAALDLIDGAPWGATEWLYQGGNAGSPVEQWREAFNNTLGYRNNRLVTVYNWENLPSEALLAAQQVLAEAPACIVDSAGALSSFRRNATHVRLAWVPGAGADAQLLAASSRPDTDASGGLVAADIAAATLAGAEAFHDVAVASGGLPFFWTVVSRGCAGAQPQIAVAAVAASHV